MSQHTPTPWQYYWKTVYGEPDCGIFSEQRPGHAYAIARCPRYQTKEKWIADASFIVEAVNSHSALTAENASLRAEVERLTEALRFYADPVNYISIRWLSDSSNEECKPGDRARAALGEKTR